MHQSDSDIRGRLATARLPAMPQILLRLIEHCQADDAGMSELAALIAQDAAMAARILGVASSSAYPQRANQGGLEQALMVLGIDMVRSLLISESVFQVFDNFSQSNCTDLRAFWKHSLCTAVAARLIAAKISYPHLEEAYLAGLLHDVGRLALFAAAPKEYADKFFAPDDENLCAAERRTLNLTHAEAGAWLIERWKLDSFLADSVLYHHETAARLGDTHALIRILFLAHQLVSRDEDDPALAEAAALCSLGLEELAPIRAKAGGEVKKAAEYLGIDLNGVDDAPAQAASAPSALPAAQDSAQDPVQDPIKQRMAETMRNMVLASEAGRSFAQKEGEASLLETVIRSARILFDITDATILLLDGTGHALQGTSAGQQRQRLATFSIPLAGNSVIAGSALRRHPAFVGQEAQPPGLAEEQLLRLFGTDSLVCLPLVCDDLCHGVLVGGVASWQLPGLRQREGFLRAFASQAAAAVRTSLGDREETSREIAGVKEQYRDASRRVAHEVNNPLSIIKNYLSVLDRKLDRKEPVNRELSILNEEIDRVGHIIGSLADLQPLPRETTAEVNRVARDVVQLFRNTEFIPSAVRLAAHVQDEPVVVDGDPDTLKQILMNLIKNAVEALPGAGQIDVRNNGFANREGRLYVELWVQDNGPGIPRDIMARLFSPVRSTKGGNHRGLGLSIVQSLVRKMDGLITCRSGMTGTTFEILLPVAGADRAHGARPQPTSAG